MEKKSIQTLVYEELKRNIMSLNLAPGQTMSTQEIASKLNVSRTPVREAFLRLQAEGLVEMIPQKETVVSRIDLTRVEQEKFIRECLEIGVVNRFLKHRSTEMVPEMTALIHQQELCIQKQDYVGFVEADDRFHKVLFEEIGEHMAWETIGGRNGHYNRYRILFVQMEGGASSSIEQHREIVSLLEKGTEKEIRAALMAHIQRVDVDQDSIRKTYPNLIEQDGEDRQVRRIGSLF